MYSMPQQNRFWTRPREYFAPLLLLALVVCVTSLASAGNGKPACDAAEIDGAALGLCNAYCDALDCDNQSSESCDVVRSEYIEQTGASSLPCEVPKTCKCLDPAILPRVLRRWLRNAAGREVPLGEAAIGRVREALDRKRPQAIRVDLDADYFIRVGPTGLELEEKNSPELQRPLYWSWRERQTLTRRLACGAVPPSRGPSLRQSCLALPLRRGIGAHDGQFRSDGGATPPSGTSRLACRGTATARLVAQGDASNIADERRLQAGLTISEGGKGNRH